MLIKCRDGRTTHSYEVEDEMGNKVLDVWEDEYNHYRKDIRRYKEFDQYGNHKLVHIKDSELLESGELDPAKIFERKEQYQELKDQINQMLPEQQDAIIAIVVRRVSLTEYARQIGKNKSTVSRLLRKALNNLRKNLNK